MQLINDKVVFGNASIEGGSRGGWFLGHFITPDDDLRYSEDVEVKWSTHKAGETRTQWAVNNQASTLSILINGQFRLKFEDKQVLLEHQGDYVLWRAGVPHSWVAESDCIILTVRWPSKSGDSVAYKQI